MKHLLYKITCTITQRYYIGAHSAHHENDGYFGSGKILKQSVKKHGKQNHTFVVLEEFATRQELLQAEESTVNEDLLKDPLCMNLVVGGYGGLTNKEPWNKGRKCEIISENVKRQVQTGNFHCIGDYQRGREFSEDHKQKLRDRAAKRVQMTCSHCGKSCSPAMFTRWHGDSCRTRRR